MAKGDKGPAIMPVRGAVAKFTHFRGRECLISGGRGTGKTWGLLCWFLVLLNQYPKMRLLMCRKTRASMTTSTLVTWERILYAAGLSHVYDGQGRANRTNYQLPNGSEVIVSGLEEPQRLRSAEFDFVYCNEGVETTPDDWETLTSCLRHNATPWHTAVMDCNPDAPTHWVRKRVDRGLMTEFVSVHQDNPYFWDAEKNEWTPEGRDYYTNILEGMTGVRRLRFLKGIWASAEGAVFQDSWDQSTHLIDADTLPDKDRMTYFAGVDWGYRHPGVISVYGVDGEGIVYRVREIYRQGKTLHWWHAQAKRLAMDYDISAWVCDSAQPQHIALWNMSGLYAVESIKGRDSIVAGIRLIESALAKKGDGKRGLYFVRGSSGVYDDSVWYDGGEPYDPASLARVAREPSPMDVLEGKTFIPADRTSLGEWIPSVCPLQEKANLPTCTEDEFYVYSWPKDPQDGKPRKEVPVPMYDDGIDTCRYVLRHLQDGFMPGGSGEDEVEIYSDPAVDAMLN